MKVELEAGKNKIINYIINTLLFSENELDSAKFLTNTLNKETRKFDFDIKFKINGKDFDFMTLIKRIIDEEDEIIAKKVKEILVEKFEKIQTVANNIIENLEILDIDIENKV